MVFENDDLAFEFSELDAVERCFDFTFTFDEPAESLIDFQEMYRTDVPVEGEETGHGLKPFQRGGVKSDYGADIVKAEIISQLVVGDSSDVALEQLTGVKLGKMVPVVVEIDRSADELAAGVMRNERRKIHAVIDKAAFITRLFEQDSRFC